MGEHLPGKGLFGWIGRQIGYVHKAASTDVTQEPRVVYRNQQVHEATPEDQPAVKLRRTVIDEVIVDRKKLDNKESR